MPIAKKKGESQGGFPFMRDFSHFLNLAGFRDGSVQDILAETLSLGEG